MNWGRAKTILIIMFIMVDIFLLFVLLQTRQGYTRLSQKTIDETYQVLENHGIKIQPETIPQKRERNRNVIMRNHFEDPEKVAQDFLGSFQTLLADEEEHIYRYTNGSAELFMDNNRFVYKNNKQIHPYETEQTIQEKSFQASLLEKLYQLGFKKDSVHIYNGSMEDGLYVFHAVPSYQGTNIYGISMTVWADKDAIVSMEGIWFAVQSIEAYADEPLLDVTTVLVNLIFRQDDWPADIVQIETAFYVADEYVNSREITAVPVYVITDGNGQARFFDSLLGNEIEW